MIMDDILVWPVDDFNGIKLNSTITDCDYDYRRSETEWLENNDKNKALFEAWKERNEKDYLQTEYDCNGSEQIRGNIIESEDKSKIKLVIHESKDV